MIKRILTPTLSKKMADKKAIMLIGARQTGKTTWIKYLAEQSNKKNLFCADWSFLACSWCEAKKNNYLVLDWLSCKL